MLFNSVDFLLFLPLFFVLYWLIPSRKIRWQNVLILGGSYLFYGWWDWRFLFLIVFSTLVDYFCGLQLARKPGEKRFLYLSLLVNLGILSAFKYFNFFLDSWYDLAANLGFSSVNNWAIDVVLPVGISFYTFQTLSYTIDVYRKKIPAERSLLNFAAFVSFFPQLVAGPIERAKNLLPQIRNRRKFKYPQAVTGLRLILWGFFKKIVIADALAYKVEEIFPNYEILNGGVLLLGLLYFAVQIYCDFSGYSDIAIGTAKLLGIDLMVNFRFPYFSKNVTEFWRRWHISLSTWFRDYVYIPLGGSRVSRNLAVRNIFIVFLLSGFWHGANWTFIGWGLANAMLFVPVFLIRKRKEPTRDAVWVHWLKVGLTFFLVTLTWAFFRSDTIGDALLYLWKCFSEFQIPYTHRSGMEEVLILFLFDFLLRNDPGNLSSLDRLKRPLRWGIYLFLGLWIMSVFNTYQPPFIYFQF